MSNSALDFFPPYLYSTVPCRMRSLPESRMSPIPHTKMTEWKKPTYLKNIYEKKNRENIRFHFSNGNKSFSFFRCPFFFLIPKSRRWRKKRIQQQERGLKKVDVEARKCHYSSAGFILDGSDHTMFLLIFFQLQMPIAVAHCFFFSHLSLRWAAWTTTICF